MAPTIASCLGSVLFAAAQAAGPALLQTDAVHLHKRPDTDPAGQGAPATDVQVTLVQDLGPQFPPCDQAPAAMQQRMGTHNDSRHPQQQMWRPPDVVHGVAEPQQLAQVIRASADGATHVPGVTPISSRPWHEDKPDEVGILELKCLFSLASHEIRCEG